MEGFRHNGLRKLEAKCFPLFFTMVLKRMGDSVKEEDGAAVKPNQRRIRRSPAKKKRKRLSASSPEQVAVFDFTAETSSSVIEYESFWHFFFIVQVQHVNSKENYISILSSLPFWLIYLGLNQKGYIYSCSHPTRILT